MAHKRFLLFFIIVLLFTTPAFACLTLQSSAEDAYRESDVVFSGVFVGCVQEGEQYFRKYKTEEVWKGTPQSDFLEVVSASCDDQLLKDLLNKKYLVYANLLKDKRYIEPYGYGDSCKGRGGQYLRGWRFYYVKILSLFDQGLDLNDQKFLGKPKYTY